MLVLSRRPDEEVCFPNLGIRVKVLRTMGNRVRLGITAPECVEILRGDPVTRAEPVADARRQSHRRRNEMNAVRLSLELYERQIAAGNLDAANCTFLQMITRLQQAEVAQRAPLSQPTTEPGRPRVLVVEDDANERELLAGLLQMDGCQVATAEDGVQALDVLEREPHAPDVLLLDMHMPRLNGREALSAIRAQERFRQLVVFAVSGSTPEACGVTVGGGPGVDEWFEKPLNPGLLVSLMRQRLKADALVSA
jgi:carbon storage regulator CsrA